MEITQLTGSKWITSCKMEERPCSRACISRLDTTVLEKNQIFIKFCMKGDQNTFIHIYVLPILNILFQIMQIDFAKVFCVRSSALLQDQI